MPAPRAQVVLYYSWICKMLTHRRISLDTTTIFQPSLGAPRTLSKEDFYNKCDIHAEWVKSDSKSGQQLSLFYTVLTGIDVSSRNLKGARLELCDLRFSNFTNANISKSWMYGADIGGAIFDKTEAHGADFISSHCEQAKFTSANLCEACFIYAKLDMASFHNSNLSKSDFERSELYFTTFKANNISAATLTPAFGLNYGLVTESIIDAKTKLPNGFVGTDNLGKIFSVINGTIRYE